MRVVLITHFFPPDRIGGTETRTLGYAQTLQSHGHDVQVVCVRGWEDGVGYWNGYVDETYQGIAVRRISLNWTRAPDPNRFLYCNPVIKEQLADWLARWRPDIVHVTSCLTLSASVIEAAKSRSLPVVLTLTDFWFACPKGTLLRWDGALCDGRTTSWDCLKCLLSNSGAYHVLARVLPDAVTAVGAVWASQHPSVSRVRGLRGMALDMGHRKDYLAEVLKLADRVITPSAHLRETIVSSGVSRPIQVILSGHDLAWLSGESAKTPSLGLRIGYIGQILPIKGVDVLLSAYVSSGFGDRASLVIFGDSQSSAKYSQRLKRIQGDSNAAVYFRGPFDRSDLNRVFSEIDVLVVPSQWHENNPRVIQEAFATKTPVVASKVGGISEFVRHDENGLLFERGSAADLAKQLRRLLSEPGLLEQLRNGISDVRTIEDEVSELEKVYRELTQH